MEGLEHLADSCQSALGKLEFLEEFTDPLIAGGHRWDEGSRKEMIGFDSRHWTRIANDLHPVGIEINLCRMRVLRLITPVVDRVDEALSDGT